MGYRRFACQVIVNGQDVTSRFDPLLLSVSVSKYAGKESDSADIVLADKDGMVFLPDIGAEVSILLGHTTGTIAWVFDGTVDEVTSKGSRSGRQITISASAVDENGPAKQPRKKAKENTTFGSAAQEWAKESGLEAFVHQDLAAINRPFWGMDNESYMAWGERHARELGGTFKVVGKRAVFLPRNAGVTASGKALPTILGIWGEGGNLLDWSITPQLGRPRYKKIRGRYYDREKARYEDVEVEVDSPGSEVEAIPRFPGAKKDHAERGAKSDKAKSERERGSGSVTILGDAAAEPEAAFNLIGARPGVDGTYRIDQVQHDASEDGFTTKLTLKQPQDAAGKDGRGGTTNSRAVEPASTGRAAGPV